MAAEWARRYHAPHKPEHINCTGCPSAGVKTYYGEQLCEIRKCARPRSFTTCAECGDFSCGPLNEILDRAPQAKAALEALRK